MKFQSKRFKLLKNLITKSNYSIIEGLTLLQTFGTAKFIESVETHISLNINPKYNNQQLKTNLFLPNGTGKKLRIAVLIEPLLFNEIIRLGIDIVGYDDLIEKINENKINFDILITTPNLMYKLSKVGKILGPKGLMPSVKSGTVSTDIFKTILEFQKGKIEYKADKTGIVHLNFGKINFSLNELLENLNAIYASIIKNKPLGVKGRYINSFTICSTMSPSINIDLNSFKIK
jgi:large subunit ribosomal protein L1